MTVKKLIEELQKQNPDDEVHIWCDGDLGEFNLKYIEDEFAGEITLHY